MSENNVEEIVRAAVAQALERQLPSLRENIAQDVLRQIDFRPAGERPQGSATESLQKAIATVQAGTTQKEILRALLENCALYCGRAALFVIKSGVASGWQGVGFSNDEAIKGFALDISSGLAGAAMQSRSTESGNTGEVDSRFISQFGSAAQGRAVFLPLLMKDRVSALVYADAGSGSGMLDSAALDVLVRATSSWLEVVSQRKQAQKDGGTEVGEAAHGSPAGNDPFAAHAPSHAAKTQHEPEPAPAVAMAASAASGGGTAVSATPASSGEDTEIHRKAQRFARLLMDEIKLYNQAKVAEGRKHKDLYDRLKEDIEKSRSTYQKRYGNTAAASADYFNLELIRSLAEDDVSLLGSNFRR